MDLWVVGAAAAAGYIAKYWQNVHKDRDNLSESGPSNHEKHELPSCPIRRRLIRKKKKQTEEVSTSMNDRISNLYKLDSVSEADVNSSVCVENPRSSSLPIVCSTNDVLEENEYKIGLTSKVGDDYGRICTGQVDFSRNPAKKRSLRTRYGHSIKPLSALESCLLAQLYQEHNKMEEYMLSVFPSMSTTTRTLLVTDGNQIISNATRDPVSIEINADDRMLKEGNVRGVLPLPKISTLDGFNDIKYKLRKGQNERLKSSYKAGSGRRFLSKDGSADQTFLFCVGISVGIMASLLSSGREVDKLKELLKQRENLVQDLQEELEMKDSLTVKELADENSESEKRNTLTNYDGRESEDMSKIEAELEAELERLGLNINASVQEGKLSDIVELDPDFIVNFAQGELREDMVNGLAVAQAEPDSDKDASCTSRTPTGNYAVSPRELSLRLHEVIESRLEEQVKNLEQALQNSGRKVQLMESQQKRKLSSSKLRYSSGEESPISEEDFNFMAQPLVMNLSGEALDAYNEAREELMKAAESEEDDLPPVFYTSDYRGSIPTNNSSNQYSLLPTNNSSNQYPLIDSRQGIPELLYDGISENGNSDTNDEMELIKQIVEKTRKGSPAVLNAQRMLFSFDEIEH